jgi:DNA-directed RNA polymerase subunit RPC12/RpoP
MAISFQCPKCGKSYSVEEKLAGKKARCKCGHEIVVPERAPVSDVDAMSALLDAELPPLGEELPPAHAAAGPRSAPLQPVAAPRKRPQSGPGPLVWIGIGAGGLVGLAVLLIVVFLVSGPKKPAQVADKPVEAGAKPASPKYASPEEVFQANLKATVEKDWKTLIGLWTPESQEKMIGGLALAAVIMGRDDPKIGELMGKHGIDESLWKVSMPDADKPGEAMQAMLKNMQAMQENSKKLAAAVNDKAAFFVELMTLMESRVEGLAKKGTVSGVDFAKMQEDATRAQQNAKLVDVEIDGDTARGNQVVSLLGKERKVLIEFRKIDGSWLMHQPDGGAALGGAFADPAGVKLPGQ